MPDLTTFPNSSLSRVGFKQDTAPLLIVSSYDFLASSTQRAITLTPSPCFLTCSPISDSLFSAVVSTILILSCFKTYETRSFTPVSKPA